jgi:hypothetical protein
MKMGSDRCAGHSPLFIANGIFIMGRNRFTCQASSFRKDHAELNT